MELGAVLGFRLGSAEDISDMLRWKWFGEISDDYCDQRGDWQGDQDRIDDSPRRTECGREQRRLPKERLTDSQANGGFGIDAD